MQEYLKEIRNITSPKDLNVTAEDEAWAQEYLKNVTAQLKEANPNYDEKMKGEDELENMKMGGLFDLLNSTDFTGKPPPAASLEATHRRKKTDENEDDWAPDYTNPLYNVPEAVAGARPPGAEQGHEAAEANTPRDE
uniref:Uncharacterized protein n=1 Tax=Lotharella oceanica TaxID=641309 RepID=A0A7S2TK29_9EUKA